MDELIEYLRTASENANLPLTMRDMLAQAAAALEAAREDAAKRSQLLEALVAKWRRYSDGNFDDAANARSSCADLLERLIKGRDNA